MKKIEYGQTNCCVMVISREKVITTTPTVIFPWDYRQELEVKYNYNVPENTYKDGTFKVISKSEFNHIVKQIKDRYNVKFTIKLR